MTTPLADHFGDIDLSIDPDGAPYWQAMWGPKLRGKSYFARLYFASWPYDRVVIDPTRDFDPEGSMTRMWTGPYTSFPEPEDGETRVSLRLVPNRRHPDWRDELERALWCVLEAGKSPQNGGRGRRIFLHVDEIKVLFSVGHVGPAGETILNEGRHYGLWLSTCGPRTKTVDPLSIQQADSNYVFGPLHELDVRRLAECCSLDWRQLAALVRSLEHFGFLRIWTHEQRIALYPPVPA